MKQLLLLFCYLLFISNSLVLGQTDCTIEGNSGLNFRIVNINDSQINTNLVTTSYTGNLEINTCTSDDVYATSYFDVSVDGTNFIIDSTEEFGNFDKNTNKIATTSTTVNLNCAMTCNGASVSLTLNIQVTDTNNHDPEFSQSEYELKVPSPLMPLTDVTIYGVPIVATDLDFSNQVVTFVIKPDDFSITTRSTSTSKDYTAVFSTRNVIRLTDTQTYTIIATDGGNPTRSSNVTLTISVDESLSFDAPSFEQPSYSFNYSLTNNVGSLMPNDGSIILETIKPNSVSDVLLSGLLPEYSGYFKTSFDSATRTVSFEVTDPIPTTSDILLVFTLSATTDSTASTSILVYLSPGSTAGPEFNNHYYTGTYDDSSNEVQHEAITVTAIGTPEVTVSGEYADRFEIKYDEDTKSYKISVKTALTISEIKSNSYVTLTLKATFDKYSDTAALIIALPEHVLQFTEALYSASYSSDHTITIDVNHPIGFTTDVKAVSITVDETYSKNFKIALDSNSNQYVISVTEPLIEDVLKTEKEIVLALTATDAYENAAQTVVNIQLPQRPTDAPTFSQTVYVANYTSDGTNSNLALEKDIEIQNRVDQSLVTIKLDSYTDYFELTYKDNKWVLKTIKALPEEILTSRKEIVIRLTASEDNNDATGLAVVVINWYIKGAPEFADDYYSGSYPESGEGDIKLDKEINLGNIDNPDDVKIQFDSYGENFALQYSSGKWVLSITKSLDESFVSKNSQLIIVLSATETGNDKQGHAVLVLELPADAIAFEEAYYVAEYPKSGTGTIQFEKPMQLVNAKDPTKVKITLDKYADNFAIKYENDKWDLIVTNSLGDAILKANSELVMTLTANQEGRDEIGEATLVLKLPAEIIPKFSEAYYSADYPKDGTGVIEFEPSLEFSNVENWEDILITLDKYAENFEIEFDSKRWYINIKQSLDDDTLKTNSELIIILTASISGNTDSNEAILVLNLPQYDNKPPTFSKTYYTAQYPEKRSDVIKFEDSIEFTNVNDVNSITITFDNYAENFEIKYDTDKWIINIKNALDSTTLKENFELVMTLTAIQEGKENTGKATLVLKLPAELIPTFSKAYYNANYPKDGTGIIDFEPSLEFSNVENWENIVITLDKYVENFETKFDSKRWYINIKQSLDDDTLKTNSELIIIITASISGNTDSNAATLVLNLPQYDNEPPTFSKAFYTAQYPEKTPDVIEFEDPIEFTNVIDVKTVKITLDNYAENFEIKYDTDKWIISIKNALDSTTIKENSELVMTLTAIQEGKENTGKATLVLKLPAELIPTFSKAHYNANYPKDGTGIIDFEPSLEFSNVENWEHIVITLDKYAENFEIQFDSKRWYINIKQSLDDDTLKTNSELIITLTASISDNTDSHEATLVLNLPQYDNEPPTFSKVYYTAQYPEKGSGVIEFEDSIGFINVNDEKTVTITLDNYVEIFEVIYDTDKWVINIKSALDSATLKANSELVMILTAIQEGKEKTGEATLILKLPAQIVPKFSKAYYTADYPANGATIIDFEQSLEFSNVENPQDLIIELDKYTENFEIKFDSSKWFINIKKNLDDAILKETSELIMTLTATTDSSDPGEATLVLNLPQYDNKPPTFSKAYYTALYPEKGSGVIEFEYPIEFTNVNDQKIVTITLDSYADNFELIYDNDKWVLNIKNSLDSDTLKTNSELVMTLTASQEGKENTGEAILVLKLPAEVIPKFSKAYYTADYPKDGTGIIEFEPSLEFSNVDNPEGITIALDKYDENFEIKFESSRWYIIIKRSLDYNTLKTSSELVMTLTASTSDNEDSDEATLILNLPHYDNEPPNFSKPYYTALYPEIGTGVIEFENPIEFTNVNDVTTVTITLDNYADQFEIKYDTDKWVINIKSALDSSTLKANSELVMTLTASEEGKDNTGKATLVLKLPAELVPEFSKAYYTADYPKDGTGMIDFKPSLEFSNVENWKDIVIALDKYAENFEITFDSKRWYINIIQSLDEDTLKTNSELIITLTASTSDNEDSGEATLVLNLPQYDNAPPQFSKAYYTAQYPQKGSGVIELEDPITFTNVNDANIVTISLDNYTDNFELKYDTDKWVIHIKSALDSATLKANSELVMTLTAIQDGKENTGEATLVLILPTETVPKFSKAYYTAAYPEIGETTIEIKPSLEFSNVENSEDIVIALDKYAEYFDIKFDSKTWYIAIKKYLDEDTLKNNLELIMTLTASTADSTESGEATLILSLPQYDDEPPKFSKAYYTAQYPEGGSGIVVFEDGIEFTNVNDAKTVTITLSNYADNFEIKYDGDQWVMNIKSVLDGDTLKANSELVMMLIASESGKDNTGEAVLVLELPKGSEPKFVKAYYTADYPADGTGVIEFEPAIQFSNNNLKDIVIALDKYSENFEIKYNSDRWYIKITKSLADDTLKANSELIMTLTASTFDADSGQATLVLNLPEYDNEPPTFSKAYYIAQYPETGSDVISLEYPIEFTYVNDVKSVTITLDNYSENFEIKYDTDKWVINIKQVLDATTLKENSELVLTLTASETGKDTTGEAALVLKLPKIDNETELKFSKIYYTADYPESGTGTIEFVPSIEFSNVDNPDDVKIALDKYAEYFEIKYESNKWYINIVKSLDENILSANNDLIITLTATTPDNTDGSEAVLLLNLAHNSDEEAPEFSKAYYIAQYPKEGSGTIDFESAIEFTNVNDPKSVTITLDSYATNFEVIYSDHWYINILNSLEDSVLQNNAELVITLAAKEDGGKTRGQSALVLQLPKLEETPLTFEESFYVATYPETGTGTIDFQPSIIFSNVDDLTKISISLDKYSENFEIKQDSDKLYINIIKNLEQSVLTSNEELRMTLTATNTDNADEAKSALVMQLPIPENGRSLRFSEPYYLANYPKEGTNTIEFETPIEFLNSESQSDIKIQLNNYAGNFEIKYDERWYIEIKSRLDGAIVEKNTELVIALVATESGSSYQAESALVLKLSSETTPTFSAAYYLADYPEEGSGRIEFIHPLEILNVEDQSTVTISLDTYADYFEIKYDTDKWYINITKSLEDSLLHKDPEIVITLTVGESGKSALVLRLPVIANDDTPIFSQAYYTAEYVEDDTKIIEFENAVEIKNIDDASTVTITLDKYSDNFEVKYDQGRWYIHLITALDKDIKETNTELLITLTATNPDYSNEGHSALILKLPSQETTLAPQFARAYYLADYPEKGSGSVDFNKPIELLNVDDSDTVTVELDNYDSNFQIARDGSKWILFVKTALDNDTLKSESELVITMTVKVEGNTKTGSSALVIKLPSIAAETGLQFSEAFYLATYPESGTGELELEAPIGFVDIDDPSLVSITFDDYTDNFEAKYESNSWHIYVKTPVDGTILQTSREIVMKLIASENGKDGYSVIVIKLPTSSEKLAPEFKKAYYLALYPENKAQTIETEIGFSNIDDLNTIQISLDKYEEYFKISYTSNKWVVIIQKELDNEILKNKELVMTMVATETDNENKGYSALVIELPATTSETGPVFSQAYYLADYPQEYTGVIQFQTPIAFKNVDDLSKITIKLDSFTDNFEIKLEGDKWLIKVNQNLNSTILDSASELVMTLTATDTDTNKDGYSALVLKLPEKVAPIFSEALYAASYVIDGSETKVVFTTPISITNKENTDILLSVDNYQDYFNIEYDSDSKSWVVNVIKQLGNDLLTQKTSIAVALTATNSKNSLTDHAAIDLTLPYLNTDNAPKYSQTYYTALYSISGDTALVKFDAPVKITNKNNADLSIGLDNYNNYFSMSYDEATDSWLMTVDKNLDQSLLNRKVDLVMALTATETGNEYGQAVLVMRLPVVNTDDSPKFSSIYYDGIYTRGDDVSVSLSDSITITNKEDLSTITIALDDSYKDNFDIVYDSVNSKWDVKVKSPLNDDVFKDRSDIILTLTATVPGSTKIGQAALVLHLPLEEIKLAPEFGQAHYTAQYVEEGNVYKLVLEDTITVTNKADLSTILVALDSYESNFEIKFDSSANEWSINVIGPLSGEVISSTSELILTLTATETDNVNKGKSTLIIALPQTTEEIVKFSKVQYSGSYSNDGQLTMDNVDVITKEDLNNIVVSLSGTYADHFQITQDGESEFYKVTVKTDLPAEALKESILILTLKAESGDYSTYATLIINMPSSTEHVSIRFNEALYTGSYEVVEGKGNFVVGETINVETKEEDENIDINISNSDGYNSHFEWSYSNNELKVTLATDIPTDVLAKHTFIPLILTVGIKETSVQSSSVLNIEINYEQPERSVSFSSLLYAGNYKVTEGNGTLQITDTISIATTEELANNIGITVTNEYEDFFNVYISSEKQVKIDLKKPLSDTILNSSSVVPLALQATITGTSITAEAVVNIEIIYNSEGDVDSIEFGSVLYTGEYSVSNGKGNLEVHQSIKVISTSSVDLIQPKISDDSTYRKYFNVSYANGEVSVELRENLPDEAIESNTFVSLTLEVEIKDTVHRSSAVLNININTATRTISFSNLLYAGNYKVTEGNGTLQITDTISIDTEEPIGNINVIITNEYKDFFSAEIVEGQVKIEIKKQLTDTILNSSSVVPLVLQASIPGTSIAAEAVVNIEILYNSEGDTDSIEFGSVLYTGEYSVSDGKGIFQVHQSIKVISTSSNNLIQPRISDDSTYRDYFDISYANGEVTVALKEILPVDAGQSNNFITLTLEVYIQDTVHTSSAVLTININRDSDGDQASIAFSDILYTGKYELVDNAPKLTFDTSIAIETDPSGSEVEVTVTNEYQTYFSVDSTEGTVDIKIEKELPKEILTSYSVVPLVLQANIKGTSYETSAVVNLEINYDGSGDTDSILFTSLLYNGKYTISQGISSLKIDDSIRITTNRPDSDIVPSISTDSAYYKYFDIAYSQKTVTITLKENLPSTAIKNNFIALTLTVAIKDTIHSSSAVLNIGIDNKDDDNNNNSNGNDDEDSKTELHHLRITFIVVTAILSVLLLACIAGALAYYFLRIRSENYANLEEDGSGRVRFGKNSLSRSPSSNKSSALEERRPTGFVFHPISEDMTENDSGNDLDKARRKSVAFDDNVEKLQIDSVNDDDIDAYGTTKSQVTHV